MSSKAPKVVLFDIGGVCVLSPMLAIARYEKENSLPSGWINHSISASAPDGAWSRIERGETSLDAAFFKDFTKDLTNEARWRKYYARHLQRTTKSPSPGNNNNTMPTSQSLEESLFDAPPVPAIDSEKLYWQMMDISRSPDPNIYPALLALRKHSAQHNGLPIVAACSNTSIFPADHPFSDPTTTAGKFNTELKSQFDLFVSSAHVGLRKPERRIYEYTIKELDRLAKERGDAEGVKAADVVFLDDIGANLKGAKEVGMRTIKVNLGKTNEAVRELEAVTGLQLSGSEGAKAKL